MNNIISEILCTQQIWQSICSLSADSALGIDDFTGHFFQGCWSIIQTERVEMVHSFVLGEYLYHRIASTSISLIPTVNKPKSLTEYRPISLCNFARKVISKILATSLSRVLPLVINKQQFGFVRGRSIHESVALAQEIVEDLDR